MQQAVVFPGQGSQSIGMLADVAQHEPLVQATFAEASSVLGYDLWQLVQSGPEEELNKTEHAQPALLAASYAIWCILKTNPKFQPVLLAGHSLGEYSALVCAESISFKTAIKLVAARGSYMQDAVPAGEGALAAIVGLGAEVIAELCHSSAIAPEILEPANFNSPAQIVIAGNTHAVDRAIMLAKGKGATLAKRLSVSVPSHCALMKPAAVKLAQDLSVLKFGRPAIPVINNVNADIYQDEIDIRDGLTKQLYS